MMMVSHPESYWNDMHPRSDCFQMGLDTTLKYEFPGIPGLVPYEPPILFHNIRHKYDLATMSQCWSFGAPVSQGFALTFP